MSNPRRTWAAGLMALVSALSLTGCLNLAVDTSVSAAGTFTGEMVTTFDREAVGEFGIGDLAAAQQELGVPDSTSEHVSVQWSESDTTFVQTVSFIDASPDQIEAATTSSTESAGPQGSSQTTTAMAFPLTAEVSGPNVVVSLSDAAESVASDAGLAQGQSAKATARIGRRLFGDSTVSVEVTMPGPIIDVTGTIPKAAKTNPDVVVAQPDPTRFELGVSFVALAVLSESTGSREALAITATIDPALATSPATATPTGSESDPAASGAGPGPLIWVAVVVLVVVAVGVGVAASRRSRSRE